ncbi:uncharacterized protein TNCV_874501 [Trichonephila clavipes]|nr:uncharacterized protein TNCV_874501 [Trichonephila clavipes]
MPERIRFVPVYTATRQIAGSKCRYIFRTLFRLGTLGIKRVVFSNSPMMHYPRGSFIQDGCRFGLLALDNRINNNPHKHLGRPKRIGYNCPGFGSLQVPIFNKNYIPFRKLFIKVATGSFVTQNYSRSQSEVPRDLHNGAQRINPENRVGSSFRIIPEQYFSGIENIDDFLENIDHNLAYYEIPAQLACAYLKGHLKGRALDWFEVLGYRVIEDKTTDYAHLKQALSEQFPVVRNRSELETRFYSSSQRRDQQPSDFIYELLKIHKVLKLEMSEEKLIDHVVSRLEPQILDYVEVRHPRNTANLLQIVDKYEERFMHRQIRGSSEGFRSSGPHENNRFNTRHRQENWRENRNNERYANNSRPQREFNRFENQGFANRRFEGRRQGGQSDQPFHSQGGRQSGSRNSSFRGQNERSRNLNF